MTTRTHVTAAVVLTAALFGSHAAFAQQAPYAADRQALLGLARVKRDAGDRAAARRYFEDAQKLSQFNREELGEYFWLLAGMDSASALRAGHALLAVSPSDHDVRDRMITEALAVQDETAVVALATEGIKRAPESARWPRRLAESNLRQGRPDDAAAAFRTAISARDAVAHDRVGLALALEAAGRHTDSATAWDVVPATVRAEREEWERSRLRALAHGAAPAVANDALTLWLNSHQNDDATRDLLIDLWIRAGQPNRALAAIPSSPASDKWTRRRLAVARSAGLHATAIAALDELAAKGSATVADRRTLAAVLIDNRDYERASSTLHALASGGADCDGRLMTLIDRIPGAAGTNLLFASIAEPRCNGEPSWLLRGVERAVAAARHQEALALIARLSPSQQQRPDIRRLTGQLQLWTGDLRGSITTLELVVKADPEDDAARAALVDGYRTSHQSLAAWRTAEPLLAKVSLAPDRILTIAELAIEAGQPEQALALTNRIPPTSRDHAARTGLVGRSLLALGRPNEARVALASISPVDLTPPAALALIDSTVTTNGWQAGLKAVRQFSGQTTVEWRDVLARRVTLEAVVGEPRLSATALQLLRQLDETAAVYAHAETALALRRPHEALTVLSSLPNDPRPDRAADLESIALAGVGRLSEALTIVSRLRQTHRLAPSLMVREADLTFQLHPTDESIARLIEVAQRLPGNQDASVALARGLATARRYQDAIKALEPESAWPSLPEAGRLVLSRSLQALGEPKKALAVISAADPSQAEAQELLAELVVVVEGPGRATEALARAAARPDATPQLFLKWAAIAESPSARVAVLSDGVKRFGSHVGMLVALATAQQAAGDAPGARLTAQRAVDADAHSAEAWFVLIDVAGTPDEVTDVVRRFEAAAITSPALIISVSEGLTRFIRSHDDPLIDTAIAWLDAAQPADAATAMALDLARARVYSAAERWPESLTAVDAAISRDARFVPALKLRAELLSWSGRHTDAVAAYGAYLVGAPMDVEARRQQARVAGWGGSFAEARRMYRALEVAFPDDRGIAAETKAKTFWFEGRWTAAADAYAQWTALEPANGEARFEYAEALRAADRVREADAALSTLASTTNHRLATAAQKRAAFTRSPSASIIAEHKSTNGYGGQRLLDLREEGAEFRTTFGDAGGMAIVTEAAHVRAAGAAGIPSHNGLYLGLSGTATFTPTVGLEAQAAGWNFASAGGLTPDLWIRAAWRPVDRWTLGAGADYEPLFENLATLEQRIAASGAFVDAAFVSPRTSFAARLSGQSLTDGNDRTRATVSVSRSFSDRAPQLRMVGWAESLSYRSSSQTYFSPARHLRVDAGLEYAHEFRTPRFRGDRQNVLAVGYLIGIDADGTSYQHPSMRLQLEFARGLAIDARASWIRSAVYNETSLFAGLTVGLSGRGQQADRK